MGTIDSNKYKAIQKLKEKRANKKRTRSSVPADPRNKAQSDNTNTSNRKQEIIRKSTQKSIKQDKIKKEHHQNLLSEYGSQENIDKARYAQNNQAQFNQADSEFMHNLKELSGQVITPERLQYVKDMAAIYQNMGLIGFSPEDVTYENAGQFAQQMANARDMYYSTVNAATTGGLSMGIGNLTKLPSVASSMQKAASTGTNIMNKTGKALKAATQFAKANAGTIAGNSGKVAANIGLGLLPWASAEAVEHVGLKEDATESKSESSGNGFMDFASHPVTIATTALIAPNLLRWTGKGIDKFVQFNNPGSKWFNNFIDHTTLKLFPKKVQLKTNGDEVLPIFQDSDGSMIVKNNKLYEHDVNSQYYSNAFEFQGKWYHEVPDLGDNYDIYLYRTSPTIRNLFKNKAEYQLRVDGENPRRIEWNDFSTDFLKNVGQKPWYIYGPGTPKFNRVAATIPGFTYAVSNALSIPDKSEETPSTQEENSDNTQQQYWQPYQPTELTWDDEQN